MRRVCYLYWCFVAPLVLSGCGTALNFRETNDPKLRFDALALPQTVYGGLMLDACFVDQGFTTPFDDPKDPFRVAKRAPIVGLYFLDMPLSLAADTLTLPFTIYASSVRFLYPKPESEPTSDWRPKD